MFMFVNFSNWYVVKFQHWVINGISFREKRYFNSLLHRIRVEEHTPLMCPVFDNIKYNGLVTYVEKSNERI